MRVVMFDPVTAPYEAYGEVEQSEGTQGQLVKRVMSRKTGKCLIQLDCFWDYDPTSPRAWMDFWRVKKEILEEVYAGRWTTVVLDTVTGMRDACQYQKKYKDMPAAGVGEIARVVTDELEPWTTGTMPFVPCNSITLMHIDEFMVEESVGKQKVQREKKVVLAPGRLRRSIPAKFGEVYRMYWTRDGVLEMQTAQRGHDGYESCRSAIGAPDPCEPTWAAVWANKKGANSAESEAKSN